MLANASKVIHNFIKLSLDLNLQNNVFIVNKVDLKTLKINTQHQLTENVKKTFFSSRSIDIIRQNHIYNPT